MSEAMIRRASPWYVDGTSAILRDPLGMQSSSTYTKKTRVPASELGKNPDHPPAITQCGITHGYKFTLNSDKAHYKISVNDDYAEGDILMHFHWTKSTTNSDQSSKNVKWQLKYLIFNGVDENCNSGESPLTVEDTYESSSNVDQIVYKTGSVVIPCCDFEIHDMISLEMSAVTPSSNALDDEPVLLYCGYAYTAKHIV